MKKIFTILCLMALTVGAQAQQTYTATYGKGNGTFYDANGTVKTGGFDAKKFVSNTTPAVTVEASVNATALNSGDDSNYRIGFNNGTETITISVPDGYVITAFSLEAKAVNNTQPAKTVTLENGDVISFPQDQTWRTISASGLSTQSTYFTVTTTGWAPLNTRNFTITVQEVIENAVSVTYKVVDENGTTLTTKTESVEAGTEITSLPASMQHTLFYDYSTENYTAEEGLVATFTATPKSSAPFIPSTAASPVWYNLYIHPTTKRYPTYVAGGNPNVTLPATMADDETTQWAFIGNPYDGFQIINNAAGTSLVLGSEAAGNNDNSGGNTYATLNSAGTKTYETWTITASTHATNGFFIANGQNYKLNYRSENNLAYWTSGFGAGSTFVATKVPGLAELIPQAETLLSDLTAGANDVQIGYPTASALSTFKQAIADAKTATDEAAGLAALKAAIAAVKSPANTIYTPRTDVYYTITSARGSMIYEPTYAERDNDNNTDEFVYHTGNTNGTNNAGKTHINVSLNKENANHQWGFIEKDGVFYMYNVGKKQFAGIGKGTYGATWTFSNTPSSVTLDAGINNSVAPTDVRVRATSAVTGKTYSMSISPSYHGPVITYDDEGDGGIPMTFAVATATQDAAVTTAINALLEDLQPYRDALQEVIDKANSLTFGTGLGEYTASTDFTNALTTAESQVDPENTSATKESITAARTALETAIAASLNMPTVGKFYRIKTAKAWATEKASNFNNTQPYLIGENHSTQIKSTTRAAFSTTAGEDASSIWYLTTIGESPTQYLVNFSNGRPAVNNSGFLGVGKDAQFLSSHGTSIVFKAATNGEIGAYGIVFAAGTRSLYTNVNLYTDAAGADGSGAGYNFELEEVPSLPITMHDGQDGRYYATFSAPVAISSITGATAHKVKVENEKAKYSETGVEGIPAGTGVLLINETGDKATLTIGDFTDAIDTDLQYIFAAETSHEGLFFGLSTENKLGFFKLMEGGSTGGFKAYLNAPASAKGVELVADNEATGIENMEHGTLNMENGAVYNLQGQRVVKAQKGVFIQNGKKVVVK